MYEIVILALAGIFAHLYIRFSERPRGHRPVELELEISPDAPIDSLRVNDEPCDRRGFSGRLPSGSRVEIETSDGVVAVAARAVVDGRAVAFGEWRA